MSVSAFMCRCEIGENTLWASQCAFQCAPTGFISWTLCWASSLMLRKGYGSLESWQSSKKDENINSQAQDRVWSRPKTLPHLLLSTFTSWHSFPCTLCSAVLTAPDAWGILIWSCLCLCHSLGQECPFLTSTWWTPTQPPRPNWHSLSAAFPGMLQ